ncbi:DUF423 domain-containing protein [Brucella anthropi]|jgi:uncharacterized membrane protein YgdD (TMEM256/DUF423 family)|uniref:DUF423 domain-containing protein n=1 Tax=Brucella anthropi TaxID=529 RepID=A0A011UM52_BRUAN|nr:MULTISPECIES: DUF423 domain-containing protein [Brucella/Ochrobactrum group]QOD64217.1 DUF423 domain-containing protein [Ochrobactrum sp. MT180101]QTN02265.1 DUF423 domain-containing protein [Ochrobactrum sp. EEELCW01]RNL41189.1 DUF423 domain-containing protein [Ochrobactrum sp. MH181795]EXL06948.1 oxidoreductase [Brucella anthropi]KAB2723503.1 DUF423 domain-containing protein [Brucella anthropi]
MKIRSDSRSQNILFSTLAGLCGALAIAAYAGAAHGGENHLGNIAPLLLGHAPAFLVLSLIVPFSRTAYLGGALLVIGLALFCGDLFMRDMTSDRLFPMAAPIGGSLMILGWLAVAVAGWFSRTK